MKVVAFVGPKGSGKDTCADILKKDKLVRASVPFALPLKRICCEVFNIHYNLMNDPVLKEKTLKEPITVTLKHLRAIKNAMLTYVDPYEEGNYYNLNKATDRLVGMVLDTPRKILQIIGTEFIRNEIHPDWHCMAAFSERNLMDILKSGNRNVTVAVTDCRFPNELNYLINKFGDNAKFFYVQRPEAEKVLAKATHASETSIIDVKNRMESEGGEVIVNDGTLDDLKDKLANIKIPTSTGESEEVTKVPGSRFKWKQVRGA